MHLESSDKVKLLSDSLKLESVQINWAEFVKVKGAFSNL